MNPSCEGKVAQTRLDLKICINIKNKTAVFFMGLTVQTHLMLSNRATEQKRSKIKNNIIQTDYFSQICWGCAEPTLWAQEQMSAESHCFYRAWVAKGDPETSAAPKAQTNKKLQEKEEKLWKNNHFNNHFILALW